jgi:hypothetical protein
MWEGYRSPNGLAVGEAGGVPVIHRVDVAGGLDEVFRRGAYAAAVAVDGRVGYVLALDGAYWAGGSNATRVVVASPGGWHRRGLVHRHRHLVHHRGLGGECAVGL